MKCRDPRKRCLGQSNIIFTDVSYALMIKSVTDAISTASCRLGVKASRRVFPTPTTFPPSPPHTFTSLASLKQLRMITIDIPAFSFSFHTHLNVSYF